MTTMASAFVNSYCTAHSLVGGVQYNGKECFVAKVDPQNPERVAVIFTHMLDKADYISLKPQNLTKKYEVEVRSSAVPGAGLGLFATRDFKAGEIIMMEKPFLEVPDKFTSTCDAMTPELYTLIIQRFAAKPVLEVLETLTHVPNEFNALTSVKGGAWAIRMGNNALSAQTPRADTSTLYPLICRINHACLCTEALNVVWNTDTHRTLTAVKDIKAGEEFLTEYNDSHLNPAERKKALQRYGIPLCGSSVTTKSECNVCCNPKALILLADLAKSIEGINRLSETALPSLTGGASLPPRPEVTRQWIEEGIALSKHCNQICKEINDTLLSPASNIPLRGRVANAHRYDAQKMLLAMLFQTAVCQKLKSEAKALYALLMDLFTDELADRLLSYGGNESHPLFVSETAPLTRSMANTNEFMKHAL